MSEVTPLAQLGRAFGFTPEDLQANRARRITQRQRQNLNNLFVKTVLVGVFLLLLPALVGLAIVAWQGGDLLSLEGLLGLLIGLILFSFYAVANYRDIALIFDLSRGTVEIITGKIERTGAYLNVGRHQFLLEEAKLDLIQSGLRYTFYYLPVSKRIIGVEFAE
ncbi:MAG: hypothetical protein L0154_27415 [Chloroflexi bacterium]|nr:hypothetical protein [Chloroflexota bacterium]